MKAKDDTSFGATSVLVVEKAAAAAAVPHFIDALLLVSLLLVLIEFQWAVAAIRSARVQLAS